MDRSEPTAGRAERIRAGDRRVIARAITSIENGSTDAPALLAALADAPRHARIVGITGPPGAGKSTLVNALAKSLLAGGRTVAIVAVDPSSPITGGAVLGDRVRMGEVHADACIFIRSLATRGHLGGLTRTTRDVVLVLNAARFDVVIVETVGAGQSEVAIAGIAETKIVVCPPGLGDDVQALKAGILEIADIFVVNKADLPDAARTEQELRAMLALRAPDRRGPVLATVATRHEGIQQLVEAIDAHRPSEPRAFATTAGDQSLSLLRKLAGRDAYMKHLGIELVDGGVGYATVRMRIRPEHINFFGKCHGGALFSLADMALGLACNSYGTLAALVDAHMTFQIGVNEGEILSASALEISRTRKLATYRMDVTRADAALVASLTGTVYLTGQALAELD